MTEDAFVAKVHWEGGVFNALEYGLRQTDLDDPDSDLGRAWGIVERKYLDLAVDLVVLEDLLEEFEDD